MLSTIPAASRRAVRSWTAVMLAASLALSGCAISQGPVPPHARLSRADLAAFSVAGPVDGAFTMEDGARLPYRAWMPMGGEPRAVLLALHGMNDSRDAWEIPAAALVSAGIAVVSPDQRGFGDGPSRGRWPGGARLVTDAAEMARALRTRFPHAHVYLMGESMGAAVLMCLAASNIAPPVDGYVLVAPAVWGRAEMNVLLRVALFLGSHLAPGLTATGAPGVHITASSNYPALVRLSRDPLTLKATRLDSVRGLVDLMDEAQAAAPGVRAPMLVLYGGHDQLVPKRATEDAWRALPPWVTRAYYPDGYHLLLRDLDRDTVLRDVIAWLSDPKAPLPSGADQAARAWVMSGEHDGG